MFIDLARRGLLIAYINGKFLIIATPKKQIKISKHISTQIRSSQSFAFIFIDLFLSPASYDEL